MKSRLYLAVAFAAMAVGYAIYYFLAAPRTSMEVITGPVDQQPLAEQTAAESALPAVLPDFTLGDLSGAPRSIRSWPGKSMIVNFWATWCAPCLEEMPSIERLRRSLDAQRFAVVAVNVGEGPAKAGGFVEKMGLDGFHVLLDREVKTSKAWGARVLPATFIVAPDGSVRYSYFGALDWSRPDIRAAISRLIVE
jgi:thiol-disulfide isomerase/thioredoxin